MPKVTKGVNTLKVYVDYQGDLAPPNERPMWDDFVVYHVPNDQDAARNLPTPTGPPAPIGGIFNQATHFSGSSMSHLVVEDPGKKLDDLFPTITITAWIKPNTLTSKWGTIVSRQLRDDAQEDFNLTTKYGRPRGCAGNTSCGASGDEESK